jgi:hypothetical protein
MILTQKQARRILDMGIGDVAGVCVHEEIRWLIIVRWDTKSVDHCRVSDLPECDPGNIDPMMGVQA